MTVQYFIHLESSLITLYVDLILWNVNWCELGQPLPRKYFFIIIWSDLKDNSILKVAFRKRFVKTIIIGHVLIQTKLCVGWGRTNFFFWITNMTNYYLFYVIIAIWEWIVQYFSSYLHYRHCIFASILLITYKRILYISKLTWKHNVFMSMTWKWV